MRAMVLEAAGRPLRLVERAAPVPGPGEVAIAITACGVCRTDLHIVDGELNGFSIRRLKYKLGTRSMASGEIDFRGALAEPVGDLSRGFKTLVSVVLDTSRVQNAVVTAGVMRRAYVEAQTFARARRAFGRPIIEHAMVQQTLARMRVMTSAAVASTFRIMAITDRLAAGEGGDDLAAARRTHVNINKYWTSLWCTRVVRDGIEVLGGNGAIEEFSVLPRLYRDSIVLESWEGTHNTLCAQVLRDFAQRKLHQPWLREVEAALAAVSAEHVGAHHARAKTLLADVSARIERLLTFDAAHATLYVRHVVDQMCLLQGYSALLLELSWQSEQGIASDKALLVELYRRLFIDEGDPMEQLDLPELYRRASAQL